MAKEIKSLMRVLRMKYPEEAVPGTSVAGSMSEAGSSWDIGPYDPPSGNSDLGPYWGKGILQKLWMT